jgi:hypothetical protein
MFIANSWITFMMSPPGELTPDVAPETVQFWSAFANATWMPINIHRLIANAVFGGSVVAAYSAYRFLKSTTDAERAHYDWMGYVGNLIAIGTFLLLPFAGYWLGREIYEFNQQMGVTMMGGFMSWLWIVQAFLIGVLFLLGRARADPRGRAIRSLHEVDARRARPGRDGVGHPALDDRGS